MKLWARNNNLPDDYANSVEMSKLIFSRFLENSSTFPQRNEETEINEFPSKELDRHVLL